MNPQGNPTPHMPSWDSPHDDWAVYDERHGPAPVGAPAALGGTDSTPRQHEPPAASSRRRWVAAGAAAVLVASSIAVGVGATLTRSSTSVSASAPTSSSATTTVPSGSSLGGNGSPHYGVEPASLRTTTAAAATAAEQVGVVDIDTVLGEEGSTAAGTGMVLTASGEVLTNNHVIDGATSISVTVVTTGRTYKATVVGYDVTADIAVLQLVGASGLATVSTDTSAVAVGDSVVGVGNAGGVGGTPSAAAGTITAVSQTITASEDGSDSERLTGLIETNAPIAAGDSGGPLFDTSGAVIGMDTAASASGPTQAYAITIGRALTVARAIEAGHASATVHIGGTAFIGVEMASSTTRAVVAGVVAGTPAASAGLAAGDVITALAGHSITSSSSLSTVIGSLSPGKRISLHWTDTSGRSHTSFITLAAGPAA